MARCEMSQHRSRVGMALLALVVGAGASAAFSAVSDPAVDDQADGVRANAAVPSNWTEPTTSVTQVTIPPSQQPPAVPEKTLSANPLWAMPLAQFPVTRDRPIFLPSRRPPAPPATVAVAPKIVNVPKPKEPERPQLSLVGTITGDEANFGIFVDQSTKAVVRLKVGEDFQGWKLQSVRSREAALEKNQAVVALEMPQPGLSQPAIAVHQEVIPPGYEANKVLPVASQRRQGRQGVRE